MVPGEKERVSTKVMIFLLVMFLSLLVFVGVMVYVTGRWEWAFCLAPLIFFEFSIKEGKEKKDAKTKPNVEAKQP
jgi:hypothetical protein